MTDLPLRGQEYYSDLDSAILAGGILGTPMWISDSKLARRSKIAFPIHYHSKTRSFYLHTPKPGTTLRNDAYTRVSEEEYVKDDKLLGVKFFDDKQCEYIGFKYTDEITKRKMLKASIRSVGYITTLHTNVYDSFKPTVDEVLSQLPITWFKLNPRFYFHTVPQLNKQGSSKVATEGSFHRGITTIYVHTPPLISESE